MIGINVLRVFRPLLSFCFAAVILTGCASSSVDMEESSRVLGKENDVRVDAQFFGLAKSVTGSNVSIVYEIENLKSSSIAFAEMVPETSYDEEMRTFTVIVGSEVPGNQLLPRLVEIKPGERISFNAGARLVEPRRGDLRGAPARDVQLKVVYLRDPEPFRALIGISEVAVQDPELADSMFTAWLESTESVTTNAVPLKSRLTGGAVPERPR